VLLSLFFVSLVFCAGLIFFESLPEFLMVSDVSWHRKNEEVAWEQLNNYYLTLEDVVQKRYAIHVQKE